MTFDRERFAGVVKSVLLAATVLVLAAALWFAVQVKSTTMPPVLHTARLLGGIVFIWVVHRFGKRLLVRSKERMFLYIACAVFVVLRLAWILSVPTAPVSDCVSYHTLALDLSHLQVPDPSFTFLHSWGYAVALSWVYSAAGNSLLAAKLFNLVVGAATLVVFHRVAMRVCDKGVARVATCLFVLWPSQLMLTNALLSEHLALLFALLMTWLVFMAVADDNRRLRWHMAGGAALAVAMAVRWAEVVVLPCCVALIFGVRNAVRPALKASAAIIVACFVVYGVYDAGVRWTYSRSPKPSSVALLTGTNAEADGLWNEKDAQSYLSRVELGSFREADRYVWTTAFHRIVDSPGTFLRLVGRKFVTLWKDENYGPFMSTHQITMTPTYYHNSTSLDARLARFTMTIPHLHVYEDVTQYFYIALLLFGIIGAVLTLRARGISDELAFLLLVLLVTVGTFLIAEAQSRYLYSAKPVLLLLAARGLAVPLKIAKRSLAGRGAMRTD